MIPWLRANDPFPPLERAVDDPNGLLAAGGGLQPARLLDAYRRGIFPWSSDGQPLLWWSPDPRMVLFTDEFRISRSLRKRIREARFEIRVDTGCEAVIEACAEPREGQSGTWITEEIRAAYGELHRRGYVHSVEAWRDGRLVGGLYGVALGRVFFGESMITRETDASKVALAHLVDLLTGQGVPRQGYPVLDGESRVGEVTSGTMSPSLHKPIGLAYVANDGERAVGSVIQIEIRGKAVPACIAAVPFYAHRTKRG